MASSLESTTLYLLGADLLLFTHVLFVVFVIISLLLIIAGKFLSWPWVQNPWFRLTHLVAIVVVVLQSWLGAICPLTTWEMALRTKAGGTIYPGSFISHWLSTLLFYEAPDWVFVVSYTAFGLLVLVSWFWVRPRPFGGDKSNVAT